MLSPLLIGISAIEYGYFVFLSVEEVDEVFQAIMGYRLANLIGLLVVVVEELIAELHIVI